ncbi:ribonuclease J [Patescibacteria group bacterium]|nr:ribonuclease J [Patescibacteria group bacterium]
MKIFEREEKSPLKIISLGGWGKVTENLFVYEYQDKILIIDCGIGFAEKNSDKGDLIVADASYLEKNRSKILAIALTHGHEDHIGALPYVLPKIGKNIPLYGSKLTAALIEEKFREHEISNKVNVVKAYEKVKLGPFTLEFVNVTHSIPDACNIAINTPLGMIYHASDFKFDWTPPVGKKIDAGRIASIGNQGVVLMLSDCLGSERSGYTLSESSVEDSLEREMRGCRGRVFVTTISSNISRWQQAMNVALRYNRKVALAGRSIEKNIEVASRIGYMNIPKGMFVKVSQAERMPANRVCFFIAGSQGQEGSTLDKVISGVYRGTKMRKDDKVIFSSDNIPGTEVSVYGLIDKLCRQGLEVSYSAIFDDLHVSGHGSQADLALMLSLVRPLSVVPIGGAFRHMKQYSVLADKLGYKEDRVLLPSYSNVIEVTEGGKVSLQKGDLIPKAIYVKSPQGKRSYGKKK